MEDLDIKNKLYISSLSGASAGIIVDVLFYPLDTIKTFLQVN